LRKDPKDVINFNTKKKYSECAFTSNVIFIMFINSKVLNN